LSKDIAGEGSEIEHAGKCEIEEFHVSSVETNFA
jgi:hypothetical protein